MSVKQKLEVWCYGGNSKAFFIAQGEAIHQYNTKIIDQLLLIMTIILGCYVLSEASEPFTNYFAAYLVFFIILLLMYCSFKWKAHKSIIFTRTYIVLFSSVMFMFVCLLGTVFEQSSRAIMFIVYLLALPMFFVIPTHYTYSYLVSAACIFSAMSLSIKQLEFARMDVAHSITTLVIGIFMSHHILESRMTLYALNDQLDTYNAQLGEQLQEKEEQLLLSQISVLLSQIQPHFLYNTLTVICGLCDENPKEAKKVTADFAEYLRHNLDTLHQHTPVPFLDELQHTERYLSIEKKRFEDKLHVVCDIKAKAFCLPALTVQPLVENAVKHGILKRKQGGTITIKTIENIDSYDIIIIDDGIGFDPSKALDDPDKHIGIKNVRERLWMMCRGTLIIESEAEQGTTAIITIPKGEVNS